MRLRVLDFGYVPAIRSQAVYHGVARTITAQADPVLTLVNPETPYVCVGVHQEIATEVDEAFCESQGLQIIRRHVGGGAVYLDRNQMFFHFMFPRDKAPQFAANLYPRFIEPAVRTYRELGVAAEYRPINDIHVAGRKIGGTGAASIDEATVMVGSFMFDFDTETMSRCLKVPSEKFRDKLKQTLDDYMTTMTRELTSLPERETVKQRFLHHCAEVLSVDPVETNPTPEELRAIEEEEKALSDPAWTYRKGRKWSEMGVKISEGTHLGEGAHKARGGMIRVHLLSRDDRVENLVLAGDFTCLPENGVEALAVRLCGTELDQDKLTRAVEAAVVDLLLDIPGVEAGDLATAIMAARQSE